MEEALHSLLGQLGPSAAIVGMATAIWMRLRVLEKYHDEMRQDVKDIWSELGKLRDVMLSQVR